LLYCSEKLLPWPLLLLLFCIRLQTSGSLLAPELHIPDYQTLWEKLGIFCTFHGVIVITGGLLSGPVTCKLAILPRWASVSFLLGIVCNLIFGIIDVPDITQIIGIAFRNLGLVGGIWYFKLT